MHLHRVPARLTLPALPRRALRAPRCAVQGNVKLLLDDVKELRPTLFIAVPRILQRIADGVKHKVGGWAGGWVLVRWVGGWAREPVGR